MTQENQIPIGNHPLQNQADQLDLEIQVKNLNLFGRMKRTIKDNEIMFEAVPYWKNGINIFALITIIAVNIIIMALLIFNYNSLPDQISVFYTEKSLSVNTFHKNYILFVPIFVTITEFFIYYLTYRIFSFDRRLALVINVLLAMVTILYFVSIGQIISLKVF